MKALRIILLVLLGIFAIFLIYLATLSGEYKVVRKIEIQSSPEMVGDYISDLNTWKNWSYWDRMDSTNVMTYGEISKGKGATYNWKGDATGEGGVEILNYEPGKLVSAMIRFFKPFESEMNSDFILETTANGVQVSWENYGKMPFFMRFMASGMDAAFGNQLDSGLIALKAVIESQKKEAFTGEVQSIDVVEMPAADYYFIAYQNVLVDTLKDAFFARNYEQIEQFIGKENISEAPFQLITDWNDSTRSSSFHIAMASAANLVAKAPIQKGNRASGKMVKAVYRGPYQNSDMAHYAIADYLKENNLEIAGPVWESYPVDPTVESNSDNWITIIYYPIR